MLVFMWLCNIKEKINPYNLLHISQIMKWSCTHHCLDRKSPIRRQDAVESWKAFFSSSLDLTLKTNSSVVRFIFFSIPRTITWRYNILSSDVQPQEACSYRKMTDGRVVRCSLSTRTRYTGRDGSVVEMLDYSLKGGEFDSHLWQVAAVGQLSKAP